MTQTAEIIATGGDPTTPSIGIYYDVPAEVYHAWKLPSNSLLSKLNESPLQAKFAMDFPEQPTPAMKLGSALHTLILEPTKFAERYVCADQCDAIKKSGGRCENSGLNRYGGFWYCGVHNKGMSPDEGLEILPPETWDCVHGMRDRMLAVPATAKLMAIPSKTEVSIVFNDPATDVTARMRLDWMAIGKQHNFLIDIKTTMKGGASKRRFPRTIFDRGYFRQAAMYLRGAASQGLQFDAYFIVAVESKPPFDLGVYRVRDAALEAGHMEVTRLLRLYDACQKSGAWDGYSNDVTDIDLPAYAYSQLEPTLEV